MEITSGHGCQGRGLSKRLGTWHTIHTRMNRWSKAYGSGSAARTGRSHPDRVGMRRQHQHQGCMPTTGALKDRPSVHQKSRGEWTATILMVAAVFEQP